MAEEELRMVKGWRYRVVNTRERVFEGEFGGYAAIGSETAFALTSGEGTVYVPISKITCVELLEHGKEGPEERKEEPGVYYG